MQLRNHKVFILSWTQGRSDGFKGPCAILFGGHKFCYFTTLGSIYMCLPKELPFFKYIPIKILFLFGYRWPFGS